MLKQKLFYIIICIIIAIALILAYLLVPRKLVFYYNFPGRVVREEYKEYARELLTINKMDVTQIRVADDSRSGQCIRWILISDERLTAEKQHIILDSLFEFMQKQTAFRTPLVWEIFFCNEKIVYSAYVSRFGYDRIINDDDSFREWESVSDVENILTFNALTKYLMKSWITRPLYHLDSRPIAEMTPNIPR